MSPSFSSTILSWYSQHKRFLPWRDNPTPYHVLVSEIMLQQTQVSRVIIKFKEFLTRFPTLAHLAQASSAEVIRAWSGLGYNRRALLLHALAKEIVQKYQGNIPHSKPELLKLPGIGDYTAGALLSFAYNQPEPAIDVNVRRIYQRYFHGRDQGLPGGKNEEKELYGLAQSTIPSGKSTEFHNALMDFGSMICTRDAPHCGKCPLRSSCHFFPLYTNKKEKVLLVMEKKLEPGVHEGDKFIPNRIFRGRIVEFVRNDAGKEYTVRRFGQRIKSDYNVNDTPWLLSLCQKLQQEGLITYTVNGNKINLHLAKI